MEYKDAELEQLNLCLFHRVDFRPYKVLHLSLVLQKPSMTSTACHFTTSWNC
jgi:hypothetical protein